MLGADVVVLQPGRLLAGEVDDLPDPLGELVMHGRGASLLGGGPGLGGGQPLAHELGAVDVAFGGAQLAPVGALQVRRLRQHQQLVDDVQRAQPGQLERHAEPHRRAEVDDLARVDGPAVPQRPVRPPHLVLDLHARVAQHPLARLLLGLDDLPRHPLQDLDRVPLAAAERGLVRDLEEVAHDLAVLAVEAPHVEAHLHDALEHPLDLLEQHQGRQVDEHRGPQPGAGVRRAGRQVADLLREGEVERLVQLVVGARRPRPTPRPAGSPARWPAAAGGPPR